MPLPVLKITTALTPDSIVRAWLQSESILSQALVEPTHCNGTPVYCDPTLDGLPEANRVADAHATGLAALEQLLVEADTFFSAADVACRQWIANPTLDISLLESLRVELTRRSFRETSIDLWVRSRPSAKALIADLQIVPARSCYEQVAALFAFDPVRGRAISRWVDEPRIDSLVALRDRRAVGYVSVLSLGQVGRIHHLFVRRSQRRKGIGGQLLLRALEICSRSLFQHVFATMASPEMESLFRRAGFAPFATASLFQT